MPVAVLLLAMDFLCGPSTSVGHNTIHTKADKHAHVHSLTYINNIHHLLFTSTHTAYAQNHFSYYSTHTPTPQRRPTDSLENKEKHNVSLTGVHLFPVWCRCSGFIAAG